jgi:hypothetical protein
VTPCWLVGEYHRFGNTYWHHLKGWFLPRVFSLISWCSIEEQFNKEPGQHSFCFLNESRTTFSGWLERMLLRLRFNCCAMLLNAESLLTLAILFFEMCDTGDVASLYTSFIFSKITAIAKSMLIVAGMLTVSVRTSLRVIIRLCKTNMLISSVIWFWDCFARKPRCVEWNDVWKGLYQSAVVTVLSVTATIVLHKLADVTFEHVSTNNLSVIFRWNLYCPVHASCSTSLPHMPCGVKISNTLCAR